MPPLARPTPILRIAFLLFPLLAALSAAPARAGYPLLETPSPAAELGERSEATAYALALGGTLAPFFGGLWLAQHDQPALGFTSMVFGLSVGPSLGQFYAGSPGQGLAGLGVRAAGGLLALVGLAEAFDDWGCEGGWFGADPAEECDDDDGTGLMVAGTLLFGAGTLYSLADTHFAMERRRARRSAASLGLAPTLARSASGDLRPGLQAMLRF